MDGEPGAETGKGVLYCRSLAVPSSSLNKSACSSCVIQRGAAALVDANKGTPVLALEIVRRWCRIVPYDVESKTP